MRVAIAAVMMTAVLAAPRGVGAESRWWSRTLPPVQRGQTLTTNPGYLILGLFGAEYERRISDTTSWGVVGSSWGVVGTTWGIRLTEGATFRRYRSLQVLARYHPQEAAPSGLYVGVQGGLHVMDDDRRPGIGVELGETRFFGREERFSFGSGFGFTRVLGGRSAGLVLKSARINVGLAF